MERGSIAWAIEREHEVVLVGEESVREITRLVGLEPRGTLSILFDAVDRGELDPTERIAQVYRHSDGYPESVLPLLRRLKALLDVTRTERSPGYAAAQFVFLDKLRSMGGYIGYDPERSIRTRAPEALTDPASFEHLDQPMFLLGHGVENPADDIHGDEEYLYVVEIPRVAFGEVSEWAVRVSEHYGFPRWDGPTDGAFERVTWQFEGPIDEAIAALVGCAWGPPCA